MHAVFCSPVSLSCSSTQCAGKVGTSPTNLLLLSSGNKADAGTPAQPVYSTLYIHLISIIYIDPPLKSASMYPNPMADYDSAGVDIDGDKLNACRT